jgi:hypothetical protein
MHARDSRDEIVIRSAGFFGSLDALTESQSGAVADRCRRRGG